MAQTYFILIIFFANDRSWSGLLIGGLHFVVWLLPDELWLVKQKLIFRLKMRLPENIEHTYISTWFQYYSRNCWYCLVVLVPAVTTTSTISTTTTKFLLGFRKISTSRLRATFKNKNQAKNEQDKNIEVYRNTPC